MILAITVVGACSTTPATPTRPFCAGLAEYAPSIDGEPRSITLGRGGAWMVDHYKFCKRAEEDKAGIEFCDWLMEHTLTEFMEANINTALSCLQGQEIKGYIGKLQCFHAEVLGSTRPIGTFSARIRFARALDWINEDARSDLDVVRAFYGIF